ncbi:hypothetical protein D3C83_216950 [compost metagenome]
MALAFADGRVRLMNRNGARHFVRIGSHTSVVDERVDRNQLRQLGNTPGVIRVEMR